MALATAFGLGLLLSLLLTPVGTRVAWITGYLDHPEAGHVSRWYPDHDVKLAASGNLRAFAVRAFLRDVRPHHYLQYSGDGQR